MRSRSVCSAIALGAMLASASAYAADSPATSSAPQDRTKFPFGEAVSDRVIEGKVAAVDRTSGRLVLRTADGLVNLRTWPDQIRNLEVGDQVRVSFVSGSRN
jgi:hypothetical protein